MALSAPTGTALRNDDVDARQDLGLREELEGNDVGRQFTERRNRVRAGGHDEGGHLGAHCIDQMTKAFRSAEHRDGAERQVGGRSWHNDQERGAGERWQRERHGTHGDHVGDPEIASCSCSAGGQASR